MFYEQDALSFDLPFTHIRPNMMIYLTTQHLSRFANKFQMYLLKGIEYRKT